MENEMKSCDVVIAGAGVAGCLAARDLAAAGHSVLVLENRGRKKMGHDWWDTVDCEVFDEVGLAFPGNDEIAKSYEFTVYTPVGGIGATVKMPACKVNIERKPFARRLISEAEKAGAEFVFRATVENPIIENGQTIGLSYKNKDGKSKNIRAKITMDATGAAGTLRRKMPDGYGFVPVLKRGEFVVTYREIREDLRPDGKSILVIGKYKGAQWLSRGHNGMVDIMACTLDEAGRMDPKKVALEIIEREGGVGGKCLRGGYYERIPLRRGFDSFVAPGFMLIGDSACTCNPMNGSGISSGLRSASIAAKTAHHALVSGGLDIADLWSYNHEYKITQDVLFAKLFMLQQFINNESDDNIHSVFNCGMFDPDKFWELEHQIDLHSNINKIPKVLKLLDRPVFLTRMSFTFALLLLLEKHYLNFPKTYNPRTFREWRNRTRLLFDMIPKV